jgi:hypothetical protein
MCTTHPDIINPDLLAFIREEASAAGDVLTAAPVMA